jgi:shikimate kinase
VKVFLIGLMGSGKTHWAAKLGALLNIPVFDLDAEIEKAEHKTVAEIFAGKGENYFRRKENDVLKSFGEKTDFILATGGGAPCFFDSMEWMNKHGITIWIDEPVETIAARLEKEKSHRPLLTNVDSENLVNFLAQMRDKRKPFYSSAKFHLSGNNITEKDFLKIIRPHE